MFNGVSLTWCSLRFTAVSAPAPSPKVLSGQDPAVFLIPSSPLAIKPLQVRSPLPRQPIRNGLLVRMIPVRIGVLINVFINIPTFV